MALIVRGAFERVGSAFGRRGLLIVGGVEVGGMETLKKYILVNPV